MSLGKTLNPKCSQSGFAAPCVSEVGLVDILLSPNFLQHSVTVNSCKQLQKEREKNYTLLQITMHLLQMYYSHPLYNKRGQLCKRAVKNVPRQ